MSSEQAALPIERRGMMFVLSSPSGAGKSTLARRLLAADSAINMSVSVTTREPRPGEVDGVDYIFRTQSVFEAMVAEGAFLEHAQVYDHFYGTPRAPVEAALAAGRDVLFDIDWQGAQQLEKSARADLVRVFILPPSAPELERRLRARAQDSDAVVARRMDKAADEMSHWPEYDYVIVNTDVEESHARVMNILGAERVRRERQPGLTDFVAALRRDL